jgi:transposase-like protein
MQTHPRATLGPAGRQALVAAIEDGMSLRAAAATFNVSPATAHRWWHRKADASSGKATGAWWCDRSSRPHRSPRRLTAAEEERILRARRETNLGPGRGGDRAPGALDDPEGAPPPRALAPAPWGTPELPPLRVVAPRSAAAHGRQAARALRARGPPGHRRPHRAQPPGRLRLPALRGRRPLAAGLRGGCTVAKTPPPTPAASSEP